MPVDQPPAPSRGAGADRAAAPGRRRNCGKRLSGDGKHRDLQRQARVSHTGTGRANEPRASLHARSASENDVTGEVDEANDDEAPQPPRSHRYQTSTPRATTARECSSLTRSGLRPNHHRAWKSVLFETAAPRPIRVRTGTAEGDRVTDLTPFPRSTKAKARPCQGAVGTAQMERLARLFRRRRELLSEAPELEAASEPLRQRGLQPVRGARRRRRGHGTSAEVVIARLSSKDNPDWGEPEHGNL